MMEGVTKSLPLPCHFENTRMYSMRDDVFFFTIFLSVIYHELIHHFPKFRGKWNSGDKPVNKQIN